MGLPKNKTTTTKWELGVSSPNRKETGWTKFSRVFSTDLNPFDTLSYSVGLHQSCSDRHANSPKRTDQRTLYFGWRGQGGTTSHILGSG